VETPEWDWSRLVVDHLDLLDPDGNNIEALYRDVGNPGHAG
jgi:hypothetical protein